MTEAREAASNSRLVRVAVAVSLAIFTLRWNLAEQVGFGDAEALYVAYARHPQPAYLDHPGLVGAVARWLGGASAPTPRTVHAFTSVASTLFPWLGVLGARATGASWSGALRVFFALCLVPQFAIGLFALTPDLLLALTWVAALALGGASLRAEPGSRRALLTALGAGAAIGFSCLSKVTGLLLGAATFAAWCSRENRPHLRTAAPWCALAVAAILASPLVMWEVEKGFPMLRHRLIATQAGSGPSLRNLGALLGGQLLYVTPPFLYAGWRVLRWLSEHRRHPSLCLLWLGVLVPALPLVALCLWSRVAEPHWLAPAYLGLCLAAAHAPGPSRRISSLCVGTGLAVVVVAWAWVATPLPTRLLGRHYEARYDLSNDLYAWATGGPLLRTTVAAVQKETGSSPVVVGPHYIVCAQAAVALDGAAPVGCLTPEGDDFQRWFPETRWHDAPILLYVSDSRFSRDPERQFPRRKVAGVWRGTVLRDGLEVRKVTITRLELDQGVASVAHGPSPDLAFDDAVTHQRLDVHFERLHPVRMLPALHQFLQ